MPLARHGAGPAAALRALASQVHPVFMLPPVAAALFGAALGGLDRVPAAGVHAVAVFCAVYTAHVTDGYVDFHVRGEDVDHPLTPRGCRVALWLAGAGFAAATLGVWWLAGPVAALLTVPGWFIGAHHAPQLDTNPLTATTGYPLGVALALVGGAYVQAGRLSAEALAFGGVFLVLLSGVKVIDDATDVVGDRSLGKTTVAVAVGPRGAYRVADALFLGGLLGVVGLALAGPFPPSSVLAAAAFGAVVLVARRAEPALATMLLVRGSYVFLAVLVAAVWVEPLS